jgi:hypothetical protein
MALPTNTSQVADYSTIREDLENVVYKLSPTETPILQAVGRDGKFEQPHHEWSQVELAAANEDNKEIAGNDVTNDAPTTPTRLGNYTQLMDKVAGVASTNEASKAAGNVQKMAKQILYKTQELKRDMEKRLLANKAAVPGDGSTAGETAGIPSFLRSNVSRGVGGANPTLSGTTTGYPNAAATNGTQRAFTEDLLKPVLQSAWENGGNPTMVVVGGYNKVAGVRLHRQRDPQQEGRGQEARRRDFEVYESDFGQLQIVPDRVTDRGPSGARARPRNGRSWLVAENA